MEEKKCSFSMQILPGGPAGGGNGPKDSLRWRLAFSAGSLTKFTFQALLLSAQSCQSGYECRRVSPMSAVHHRETVCCLSSASETGGCNSPGAAARCPGAEPSPPMALTAVGSQFPCLWSRREGKAQVTNYGRASPGEQSN